MVKRRLEIFVDESSPHDANQRAHTIGVARTVVALRRHGIQAYPALGVAIKRRTSPRRVMSDAFAVLRSGLVLATEYEQSARSPGRATKRVGPVVWRTGR